MAYAIERGYVSASLAGGDMAVWHVVDFKDGYVFDTFDRKCDARAWIDASIAACLAANPQIGVLMRKGRQIYYVNSPEYKEAQQPFELI